MPQRRTHLLTAGRCACNDFASGEFTTAYKENVSCFECKLTDAYLRLPPTETAGQPAVIAHYQQVGGKAWETTCGITSAQPLPPDGVLLMPSWDMVTCPDCLNIHSRESEIPMTPEEQHRSIEFQERTQRLITDEHRHDWEMKGGAKWPHDCEQCIYLGTKYHSGAMWDLYWCSQGTHSTVIARRGPDGDYESGMDFIGRIPMLALAYVRALQAGLVNL